MSPPAASAGRDSGGRRDGPGAPGDAPGSGWAKGQPSAGSAEGEPEFAPPRRLAVLGLGLMGSSLGLALSRGPWSRIGWDVDPAAGRAARERGAVDKLAASLAEAVAEADQVILAAPPRAILDLLPTVGREARAGALVLDLGSTKALIVEGMVGLTGRLRPVGGHPFCGRVESGPAAAGADLYRGATFVLCPVRGADPSALVEAAALVEALGASPLQLEAAEHDRLAARVSHAPYLAAVALMRSAPPEAWPLAASGFRDATRLAATGAELGRDILATNPGLLEALGALRRELDRLSGQLSDPEGLLELLAPARRARLELEERRGWS